MMAFVTCLLRKTHYLHVHHYTWAGMCLVLVGAAQTPYVSVLCGWFNGVMIEGGARWGYDPIWNKKKTEKKAIS